jgi:hypothetical protein
MYSHLSEAVARGDVLLEWDSSKGEPPVPLVKDKFTSERRRAKTLNFSIAYGKTAIGLSRDWNVNVGEAQQVGYVVCVCVCVCMCVYVCLFVFCVEMCMCVHVCVFV